MVALRARRLVWPAMALMSETTSPMRCAASSSAPMRLSDSFASGHAPDLVTALRARDGDRGIAAGEPIHGGGERDELRGNPAPQVEHHRHENEERHEGGAADDYMCGGPGRDRPQGDAGKGFSNGERDENKCADLGGNGTCLHGSSGSSNKGLRVRAKLGRTT
jgi:hypothetical protein